MNKEQEMTSFDVVRKVGKIIGTKKTGHTGTLDPNAEGLVVVGVNRGTKFIQYVTKNSDKTYIATAKFGEKYDTGDIWGTLIDTKSYNVNKEQLSDVLEQFIGKQMQTPPMYSAKKVNGVRAYDLARKNITIDLKPCPIEIYSIKLLEFSEDTFSFEVKVSKGTYIRTLIEDICEKLDTLGTMTSLQRTETDGFNIKNSKKVDELSIDDIIYLDDVAKQMYECVEVGDNFKKVSNGAKIEGDFPNEFIFTDNGKPLAIYIKDGYIYRLQFMF